MDSQAAREYILKRLKEDLPSDRTYHSLEHTLDVYSVAIGLGEQEGIIGEDFVLLKTAALFHDAGFIYQALHHEEKGCEMVCEVLPRFNYSAEAIDKICALIMATKVPQSPKTNLQRILCDADLDYLGRGDFERIGNRLFKEFLTDGIVADATSWDKLQVSFISQHAYFTETSKATREAKKQENLEIVKSRLELLK